MQAFHLQLPRDIKVLSIVVVLQPMQTPAAGFCRLAMHFLSVFGQQQAEGVWSLQEAKVSNCPPLCRNFPHYTT